MQMRRSFRVAAVLVFGVAFSVVGFPSGGHGAPGPPIFAPRIKTDRLASSVPYARAECTTDRDPGHDRWHERQRRLFEFEDAVTTLLVETGASPVGGVSIRRGGEGPELSLERRQLQVPETADTRFEQLVGRLLAALDLAPAEEIWLDLGQPRPELWSDRTERCEPELDNVAEVGQLVAKVVAGAVAREGKARPAGRIRIDLWARVEWTGRVGALELREDAGKWAWLVPYLEALGPAMRYRPATLNDAPQTSWMSQPFELEF